ncbi:chemotaxis protein CheW [Massilia sp. WF1]|uniref:chemotaxis protein CheW n=1 Tax=unclassified Massilia TaxID=2609279 RepID=UPI00064AB4A4|nr:MULTISPECIES: chemotaxis protein CheW [unclassified Massilia]ALK98042.1 chemotaxis protein CheW [Massilia sp. WG5]KLU35515.1 chemotaxis protein CheW [Massilia sp. WF1]
MHDTLIFSGSQTAQFLSFTLGGLEYGIDFGKVQELRVLKALERFAASGEIIGGVAVSRGVVIPLVDMRVACGTSPDAPDPMTDVIILKLSSCVMGMVVDGVTGVVTLGAEQVAPLPPAAEDTHPAYLLGLGQVGGRRLILVDIEKLMSVRKPAASRQVA